MKCVKVAARVVFCMLCTGVDDIANKETQQRGKPNLDTRRLEREGTETRSEPSEEKPEKQVSKTRHPAAFGLNRTAG